MRRPWVISLLLFAVTLGVYWPVRQHDFVHYDDPQFITENEVVKSGLTLHGFAYAFTQPVVGNWHPITTLSHMLDCQLFGVNAGAHHLVNAAIHAVNAALVFLLLFQMTGSTWRGLAVAAIFALHPLRVESVAWVSERKDVLCAFFGLLSLLAYTRYAQHSILRPPSSMFARFKTSAYWLVFLFLALGLMSKAMLVTWPFVMLLLDVWPLRRTGPSTFDFRLSTLRPLLLEKLPFLALCLVFCVITLIVQHGAGAVSSTTKIALMERLVNVVMSYVRYLGHTIWPTKLAVIYPHPAVYYATATRWSDWLVILAAVALVTIIILCLRSLRTRPYLAVGWFWYLGTLVPVLGLIQVGEQAMADRYTYLPLIGPAIAMVWAVSDLAQRFSVRPLLLVLGTVVIVMCAGWTRLQLSYWRDTVTLFERTLQVTTANPSAHFALGTGFEKSGDIEQAIKQYQAAIVIDPAYKKAQYNLGQLFRKQQKWTEAATHYRATLEIDSADVPSHLNLASVLSAQGKTREALLHYDEALHLDPNSLEAMNNAAWILATSPAAEYRDGATAVKFGLRACELSSNSIPTMIGTLAAAYAEVGQFAEAIKTGEQARNLAIAQGQTELARRNEELLELYRADKPYRESAQ